MAIIQRTNARTIIRNVIGFLRMGTIQKSPSTQCQLLPCAELLGTPQELESQYLSPALPLQRWGCMQDQQKETALRLLLPLNTRKLRFYVMHHCLFLRDTNHFRLETPPEQAWQKEQKWLQVSVSYFSSPYLQGLCKHAFERLAIPSKSVNLISINSVG